MPEQSIGMATGAGDGIVGGYTTARMTAKENKSFGSGLLLTGNYCAVTGTGGTTLAIASGAIYNNGFFYENTTTLVFSTASVAAGTYWVACRVNDTSGAAPVVASATGTTIPARTVRLCIVTPASSSGAIDVLLGEIVIGGGGVITSFNNNPINYATATNLDAQVNMRFSKSGTQTISSANTPTLVTWSAGIAGAADGILFYDVVTSSTRVARSGLYLIQVTVTLTGTTTGTRALWIKTTDATVSVPFPHVQQNIGSTGYASFTAYTVQNLFSASSVYVEYESSATGVVLDSPTTMRIARL